MPRRKVSDAEAVFAKWTALTEHQRMEFDLLRKGAALAAMKPEAKKRVTKMREAPLLEATI